MQRALFIIACNYRNNRAVRPLQVGRDMVGLGGFFEHVADYDRVQILQDETRETVLHALNEELKFLKPGDLLVIYFGGHGVQTTEQLLVLPPGANDPPEAALGFLPVAELRRHTDGRGLVRAMILDSCRNEDAHSNPVTSAAAEYSRRVKVTGGHRDVGVTSSLAPVVGASKGSFAIFSACSQGEVAPELGISGKGLFSTALQNVLKQAHKAGRRTRLDDDLREQVEGEMHRLADAHGITYKPQPYKEGNGTPELLAAALPAHHESSPVEPPLEPDRTSVPARQVLLVAADGSGKYRRISDAIAAASPGTLIRVRAGTYRERLVIDKPIELVGEGAVGNIVVESDSANCILSTAKSGMVRGLTLRCTAAINETWQVPIGEKELEFCGVNIAGGRLLLDDCDISAKSGPCVVIHGADVDPVLRRCRIHDGGSGGLLFGESSRGTVEECNIFGNGVNVLIAGGADPVLRRCRIHHDGSDESFGGVLVGEKGHGTFEDCDIFANAGSGVSIGEESDPLFRRCKIYDGGDAGISVIHTGRGTFEDCNIFANARAGVHVYGIGGADRALRTDPIFRRCNIHDGKGVGVMVTDNGHGNFTECDIFANALTGIAIETGGDPFFRGCKIHDGKSHGVCVRQEGRGTFYGCEFWGNAGKAFQIDAKCAVDRQGNTER